MRGPELDKGSKGTKNKLPAWVPPELCHLHRETWAGLPLRLGFFICIMETHTHLIDSDEIQWI